LLDPALRDELPLAIAGAQPLPAGSSDEAARTWAKRALDYLFDEPNVFNVPDLPPIPFGPPAPLDPNAPGTSFDAKIYPNESGFDDALRNDLGVVFSSLNLFFKVYEGLRATGQLDESAAELALGIASDIGTKWDAVPPEQAKNVLDTGSYTEAFRRLPGFLAITANIVKPVVQPPDAVQQQSLARAQAAFALARLLRHLNCNKNYYIQSLLTFLADATKGQAIIDFVNLVLSRAAVPPAARANYDIDRAFVSRQQIVVPGIAPLQPGVADRLVEGRDGTQATVIPAVDDVEVPADGIHLEVAAGVCVLDAVPATPAHLEGSVEGAKLSFSGSSG
jgi:hypothetical protein